jgi:PBP1b-binding outer membrane lipoprotein LpoB
MKNLTLGTVILLLTVFISGCSATTQEQTSWLENSQKIDEENNHK